MQEPSSGKSGMRNLEGESREYRTLCKVEDSHRDKSCACDTFVAGSDCLVLKSLRDWEPVERFKHVSNMVSLSFQALHHTGMQVRKTRRFCLYQTGAERAVGGGGTHFVLHSHVLCSAVQLRGRCARAGLRGGPDSAEVERSGPHQQHSCHLLL